MQRYLLELKAQRRGNGITKSQWILAANPNLTVAIAHMSCGVHRLHTRMSQVGHPILCFNYWSCVLQCCRYVTLHAVIASAYSSGDVTIKLGKNVITAHRVFTKVLPF